MLGGVIAGEGYFVITKKQPPFKDGSPRLRFVFGVSMAARDEPLLCALRMMLGFGSIQRRSPPRPHWQPISTYTANSLRAHQSATIPFCERFLPPTAKRTQFRQWRSALESYDALHPHRYGKGPSKCSVLDCPLPVRGRGLCRKHYYRATGY